MKILLAVDFSVSTGKVLEQAVVFAQGMQAEVVVIHVGAPDPEFVGYSVDSKVMRDVVAGTLHHEHSLVQSYGDRLRESGIECKALLIQGPTVDSIIKEAERISADMIILGSTGKGLAKQVILGSTSEGVLHRSKVPVLVIPV